MFCRLLEASSSKDKEFHLCQPAPVSSAGPPDGTLYEPVKPAKLDATALHDCTLAATVPPSELSSHAVLAHSTGIHEEHYVSEGVEDDVPDCREYRDACTITGKQSNPLPWCCRVKLLFSSSWWGICFILHIFCS